MTQIQKLIYPERRETGNLGVHSLDHFAISVPDIVTADTFYSSFGLQTRSSKNELSLHTDGHVNPWAVIIEGPTKKLHHISFAVFEDDVRAFRRHIEAEGIEILDPPPGFESDGLWFRDHDGTLLELRVNEKSSPNSKTAPEFISAPAGQPGAPKRSTAPFVRPGRLAHVLVFTRSVEEAIRFYSRVLGLRLSDRSGDTIAFLHGIHGSDHHLIAFVKSDGPGLHHCSWEVSSVNHVGLGAMQMADKGFSSGWGLGRHVLGSNYFHYVRDPWGSYSEYSCDMDFIPANAEWQPGDHDADDSFYIWGPKPPSDFVTNHEVKEGE